MLTARAVRRLRPIAVARWELRRWAALADPRRPGHRERIEAAIREISTTGEIPPAQDRRQQWQSSLTRSSTR